MNWNAKNTNAEALPDLDNEVGQAGASDSVAVVTVIGLVVRALLKAR